MNKTAALDRGSAAPSSPVSTADRVSGITVRSNSQPTFATKSAITRPSDLSGGQAQEYVAGQPGKPYSIANPESRSGATD